MPGEIASAWVRIRPNMTGFKSETEAGVRSTFSGLAKIAGLALGGAAAFEFAKGAVSGAADLQKQIEGVRMEVGQASASVLKFGRDAPRTFGLATDAADNASVRFGILFKNLGIGQQTGAGMTIGLQKLAGAISMIRNVDPSTVLDRLPLALAGNVRALKQLGLGIDQSQIKIAAFKLGLISSVKDAITPAIKAQAIYALATAKLPMFLDQAKKHSGDLANVTRRLRAEWRTAKDDLGTALLPVMTKVATALEHWLTRMQASGKLQRDFNEIAKATAAIVGGIVDAAKVAIAIFHTFSTAVGGTKNAMVILMSVMAVNKIRSITNTILTSLVQRGLGALKLQTQAAKDEWIAANGQMKAATIGLATTIKTALITTAIGLLVVAIGVAVGYIITHWDTVKRVTVALVGGIVGLWQGLKTTLIGLAELIGGTMAENLLLPFKVLLDGASMVSGLLDSLGIHIGGFVKQAQQGLNSVSTDLMGRGVADIIKGGQQMAAGFGKNWSEAMRKQATAPSAKAEHKKFGQSIGQAIADGASSTASKGVTGIVKAVGGGTKQAIDAAQQQIRDAVDAAKSNLDTIGQKLAASIDKIMAKIGGGGTLENSPQGIAFKKLAAQIAAGGDTAALDRATQQLANQIQAKSAAASPKDQVKTDLANLTDEFNKGAISLSTFNKRVADLLSKNHVSYKTAGAKLGVAFADGFKAQVSALHQQAAAIAAVPARFRQVGGGGGPASIQIIRPLDMIRQDQAKLAIRAEKQRERQIKAADKAAAASAKSAALLQSIQNTKLGTLPGTGAKHARSAAKTGAQP